MDILQTGPALVDVARLYGVRRRATGVGYVGYVGRGNLGDELLLDANRHLNPTAGFVSLPISRPVLKAGARLPARRPASEPWWLLMGGGTLVGRPEWRERLELLARVLPGARLVVRGIGVEDPDFRGQHSYTNQDELARWVPVLRSAEAVSVRGPRSRDRLEQVGVAARVVGDPGLILGAPRPEPFEDDLVVVNAALPEDVYGGDAHSVVRRLADVVGGLVDAGLRVRMVPMATEDQPAGEAVRHQLRPLQRDRVYLHGVPGDHRALSRELQKAAVVVGQRLHTMVMAHASFVPALGIAYRPKCLDHLDAIERPEWALRSDEFSPAEVVRRVLELQADRAAQVQHLHSVVTRLRSALWAEARSLAPAAAGEAALSTPSATPDTSTHNHDAPDDLSRAGEATG